MPEVRDEEDEAQQVFFQKGTDVGILARELFPCGVDASPIDSFHYQQSVADTARYISEGRTIIYEAAFQFEGLLCALDILVKKGDKWYGFEVKNATKLKDPYIKDVAFQYYVITNAGLPLEDISLTLLDTKYIRKGPLKIQKLFKFESILTYISPMQEEIALEAIALKKMLKSKAMADIAMGTQCSKPYTCDFYDFCSKGIEMEEPDYEEPHINKTAINDFLAEIEYPIYYMDFETWSSSIPEFDGHWAFRQVCFQYSVHVQKEQGGQLEHYQYLADGVHSHSLAFLESLLSVLGNEGTILAYNKGFEKKRLNELKREHPLYEDAVDNVLERIVDLMKPFYKNYRLPEMEGSRSIKYVLPSLVPELSYANLQIGNGGDASSAFYHLRDETDSKKIKVTREALLEYCGLDTLAMVKILEKLYTNSNK